MATTISTQDIVDAKRDIEDIGEAVNEVKIVSPRYGEDFKSLPMIAAEAQTAINEWQDAINTIVVNDGVPALAISDASGETQQEINDNLKSSVFYHIDNLEDAQKMLGSIIEYQGKHFKVSAEQSKDIRHPIIKSGDAYLIPHDYTTLSFNSQSALTVTSDIQSDDYKREGVDPNGNALQGFLIDNVNNRAFLSSCKMDNTVGINIVNEYDYSNGQIGALIARSDNLSMGHADFFAVTERDDKRAIWFYKPPTGQDGANGTILGVEWKNGCTDADAFVSIPIAGKIPHSNTIQVNNFDEDTLLVRASNNNLIDIDELYGGNIVIKKTMSLYWSPKSVIMNSPRQSGGGIVNVHYALTGVQIVMPDGCFYAANAIGGEKYMMQSIHRPDAVDQDEVEGVSFWWNSTALQFEPRITSFEWQTGRVRFYSFESGRQTSFDLFRTKTFNVSYGTGQFRGNSSSLATPSWIESGGLLVGGTQFSGRWGNSFDASKFSIEQWASGSDGRYGARIAYDGFTMMMDAQADSQLPRGVRFMFDEDVGAQVTRDATMFGLRLTKNQIAGGRIHVRDADKIGILVDVVRSGKPAYYSSASGVDFAVSATASMKFGRYNITTGEVTQLMYLNDTALRPSTTNMLDLGASSGRWKKGWFNQLNLSSLSVYADNTSAKADGLSNGDVYRTSTGQLMVVF